MKSIGLQLLATCLSVFYSSIPLVLLSIILWDYFVRPRQMQELAKRYNLTYKRKRSIRSLLNSETNIIEGKISNHNISIYDSLRFQHVFLMVFLPISSTVVSVSFVRKKLKNLSVTGFGSIKEIDFLLSKIK